jgi:hypothetical protein
LSRLHRSGQAADSVNIYVLVARNTVSVKLRNDLLKKDSYQEEVHRDKRTILKDLMGEEGIRGALS